MKMKILRIVFALYMENISIPKKMYQVIKEGKVIL